MSDTVRWKQVRHHWELYLFMIPTLVLVGLFIYYPAASGVFHSFFRWNGSDISEFVGFENYLDLLSSTAFWQSFKVAFILGAFNVVKMVPALGVAVCIHRCRSVKMQYLYRTLFVIPMVIPGLVTVLIWRSFFFEATSGYLNAFLNSTGLIDVLIWLDHAMGWGGVFSKGQNPAWLGDPRLILVACIVWGFPWVGSFAVLTHLAKLQGISKDVYEAADIDGVSWWSKFTRIELPLIMGSIYLLLVFVVIDTIKDAGMVLALAGMEGGPGGVVTVPALFMIRKAFIEQEMGYACAVGIVLTLIVMALQKVLTFVMSGTMGSVWQRLAPRRVGMDQSTEAPDPTVVAAALKRYRAAAAYRMTAGYRRLAALGVLMLRALKHGAIWLVLAFAFLPLYLMVIVSFKTNKQFYEAPATLTTPMHPSNWRTAWEMVTPSVANSMFISIACTLITLFFALSAAYFFARKKMPMSGFFWNAIIVLMMMPMIANLVPLFRLLADLNLLNTLSALVIVGAASGQVFAIFVLRNFVADIPRDLYEAAEIDGANHFQQVWNVVVPFAGPILGTVGVMQFIATWNEFVLPLIVMRDHSKLPVMVQLLRLAGEYIKYWGPLMAGYAIASIPVIILFVFSMKLFVRGLTEGAVKG
ncbi:MAG: ABC transporter permease subunit [Phycisphaera sp.]|nr:ABC transporter permease subunit [Phycisphaera sp.]